MKLRKTTRKRIYEAAAKHESLTIAWPLSAPEPLPGHKYPVRGFDSETRLVVEKRIEVGDKRFKATVRLDHDPVRGLRLGARKGAEAQPMGGPQFRAETEPEQVSSRYQALIDQEGRQKTALMGEMGRQRERVLASEQKLAGERKKGKPGKLAQAQFERQAKHLRDAA